MATDPILIHIREAAQSSHDLSKGFGQLTGGNRVSLYTSEFLARNFPNEPLKSAVPVRSVVDVIPGIQIWATAVGRHIFVSPSRGGDYFEWWAGSDPEASAVPLVTVQMIGTPFKQQMPVKTWGIFNRVQTIVQEDAYSLDGNNTYYTRDQAPLIPYIYAKFLISATDAAPVEATFRFEQPTFGVAILNGHLVDVTSDVKGIKRSWTESLIYGRSKPGKGSNEYYWGGLETLYKHASKSTLPDGVDAWWETFFRLNRVEVDKIRNDTAGLTSVMNKKDIKPTIERLQRDNPLDWKFFQWLQCSATVAKQMNNRLLSTFLTAVGADYDATLKAIRKARLEVAPTTTPDRSYHSTTKTGLWHPSRFAICLSLPGASAKVQEEEAKHDWRKQQTNAGKADGLGIIKPIFPKLRKAVEDGKIPASVFHQPNGHPVNVEFPLWEKALARKGWAEVIYEICEDASRRSTYEKDITPYLMFLFKIETYLKKHSGRKWAAMPKYVQSQWELEISEKDEEGTTKQRSAFTPVADNDTGIVTVPYVAVSVSGVRTQWCYARHFHIFEEGFTDPVSGGIILNDLEKTLNGRDDYGLCYYTLTGTVTARGYPTFLVIFERLPNLTRVHFHRVRPQRSKDGVPTPGCKLVEACYQYMAGNIPAADIKAQQGDMIFIQHPNDPIAAGAKVGTPEVSTGLTFESHHMYSKSNLTLYRSAAKTPANRLGFLHAPGGLDVDHPEHENLRDLPGGWYEIRRCRSWEASPSGIWSLTID